MLRSDTPKTPTVVFSPEKNAEKESDNKKRYQHMILSLRKQIQAEESKIQSCGTCPAKKTLNANRSALIELLDVVEKKNAEE